MICLPITAKCQKYQASTLTHNFSSLTSPVSAIAMIVYEPIGSKRVIKSQCTNMYSINYDNNYPGDSPDNLEQYY